MEQFVDHYAGYKLYCAKYFLKSVHKNIFNQNPSCCGHLPPSLMKKINRLYYTFCKLQSVSVLQKKHKNIIKLMLSKSSKHHT